jgi:hypothetical protein
MDTDALFVLAETLAKIPDISGPLQEGHLTVMRFTQHWKACFRTPDFPADYGLVQVLPGHPSAAAALADLVLTVPTERQLEAALDSLRFGKSRK